jgi:phage terminase large subunit-like protein
VAKFAKGSFGWIALDYAKSVVSGKIAASWHIRAACQRTLDDAKRPDLIFSASHIDHVCEFLEALVHIKGEWAGKPIELQPFQVWIIASIFGFIRKADGLRKHRSAFILLPRKNGKSLIAAGIALYMTFADGEAGAEGYCGAANLAQANEVFTPARRMAELSPGFADAFGVSVMAKSIFAAGTGQSFVPVIAKTKDGSSPHIAICDELHQAKDATQIQAFRTGMGARRQPLLLVISTAGFHLSGICRTEQLDAEAVLKGAATDDQLFSAIYTIDQDDDWRDFSCWRKANPNLAVTISEDYLKAQHEKALQTPANQAFARTKYLNQWCASADGWLNMADWAKAGDPTLDFEALKGRPAYLGVDFSTKQDLTAIVAIVPLDDGRKAIFPFLFVPDGAVETSPNAPAYAGWIETGALARTEGTASSFAEGEAQIEALMNHFTITNAVFDQWQGENSRQKLEAKGLTTTVWAANGRGEWTIAMDNFEADLKNGLIVHPANPAMDWCAANTCANQRGVTRVPVKDDKNNKIDGMVAALMAYAVSCITPPAPPAPLQLFFLD